ncbi:agmatine deiminase family protein [uncultured Muribaculum sp.]|uniref:agmatine deiminase family protein n=1 Tax=uncultured Muribaculum sp. TaxID=1918613 RepID=UPI00272B662B|nr:agmatine deiminase family protein [uncultured Muribaculum sp.]
MMSDRATRLPAEWEPHGAVMLSWPHKDTDWAPVLDEAIDCFVEIAKAIAREETLIVVAPDVEEPRRVLDCEKLPNRILYLTVPTNDTWARDFGPITVERDGNPVICDFKFNGWGLKFPADKDNLITRAMCNTGLLRGRYSNELSFVLEGGSIESDGQGTLMTTSQCLLSPNRNGAMSRDEIEEYLKSRFGLDRVLWLDYGALEGDDTDSHIDTLARLAPNDTILYVGTDDVTESHYDELNKMKLQLQSFVTASGQPYNLIELPLPDAVYDEEGNRLPATYANFLIMNHSILMPVYRQPQKDELAAQIIKIAFPDHQVVKIDCSVLIKQHGSLHCVTMQVPETILPI